MTDEGRKLVVVIGAGASGLTAVKCCLEENLRVVCYERTNDVGGLWRYHPEAVDGQASVMRSTVINTSKEMSAFSDFPPPSHFPNFMHHSYTLEYLRLYVQRFKLDEHIRFNCEVTSVTRSQDFAVSRKWKVRVRDLRFIKGDVVEEILADGVMICTGHHAHPRMPSFEGIKEFRGEVIHAHSYRTSNGYDGKNVLVVGFGNSGVDVATELGGISKQVYLSTRKGAWVIPRVGPAGDPIDSLLLTRLMDFIHRVLPFSLTCTILETIANHRLNHYRYDLRPQHRFLSQHPTISDTLTNRLITGRVAIKGDVKRFIKSGVIFEGDTQSEHELDVVIAATGYRMQHPYFLEQGLVNVDDDRCELYKFIVPPDPEVSNLAFIGMPQPMGSQFPIFEMQSRWFLRALTGELLLPPKSNMLEDVRDRSSRNQKNFYNSSRHTTEVFWVQYMDELASDIRVKPDLPSMLFSDWQLFKRCFFGPCLPYQYRLTGPYSRFQESREIILTARRRMAQPLKTRTGKTFTHKKSIFAWNYLLSLAIFFVLLFAVTYGF